MSWRPPPVIKPGEITLTEANELNRWFVDISRFLGGITAAAPLGVTQDRAGVRFSVNPNALMQMITNLTINEITVDNLFVDNFFVDNFVINNTTVNITNVITTVNVTGVSKLLLRTPERTT